MRTDIPQAYLDAIADPSRWRLQYMVLHWPDGDQYIAGSRYQYAANKYCDALVTDWGGLADAVSVEAAISGTGSQTRQATVTLANTSGTGWWCSRFSTPPENLSVDLYQAVEGVAAPLLIGRLIVQSPIDYDEESGTVTLTLLSLNQRLDPYVGTLDPVTNEFYPVIIGALAGVPGSLYGTHPLAKLDGAVAVGATSIKTDRDLAAAGWPASGQIMLDFEAVFYTGRSGVYFTGVSGVAKAHDSGQWVFQKEHEYLFAFGAGPVDQAGPVYVNNEVYSGQHTIYKERNPVQVGFLDGFPFARIDSTETVFRAVQASDIITSGTTKRDEENVIWIERSGIAGSFNNIAVAEVSISSPGAEYEFLYSEVAVDLGVYGGTSYSGNVEVFYPTNTRIGIASAPFVSEGSALVHLRESYGVIGTLRFSWGAVFNSSQPLRTVASISKFNGSEEDSYKTVLSHVYNNPGFPKKEFFDVPSLNIGQAGLTANPADVISLFLTKKGCAGLIDSVSFDSARSWYHSNGYSMAGPVDGGKRCSEVLNEVCWMCRSFLVYDADKVFLRIRYPISSTPVTYASQPTNRKIGSLRITRQDFSKGSSILGAPERQDGVVNALTIRYSANADGTFNAQASSEVAASVEAIGRTEQVADAYLVTTSAYANNLVAFWAAERAWPYSVLSFTATALNGMLEAQLGDAVSVSTDWSDLDGFTGRIVSIERRVGQLSPAPRPNEWNIKIAGVIETKLIVHLSGFFCNRSESFDTRGPLARSLVVKLGAYGKISTFLIDRVLLYVACGNTSEFSTRGPLARSLEAVKLIFLPNSIVTNALGWFGYGPMGNFFWGW